MAPSAKLKRIASGLNGKTKLGEIKKLGKEIKIDHELALELWSNGGHQSRLLATLIFDKKSLTDAQLDAIASDLADLDEEQRSQLSDWLLANQLTKDKRLVALLESWQHHGSSVMRRWYWYYQARLRWTGRAHPLEQNSRLVDEIELSIASETPEVQWAMNFCAGWIAVFEPSLRKQCINLGIKHKLYKDDPVAKNCTPSYLPEFIRVEVAKRE